jgi:hypothetical protein
MGMWLEDFMGKYLVEEWVRRKCNIDTDLIFVDIPAGDYLEYCFMISFQLQQYQETIC